AAAALGAEALRPERLRQAAEGAVGVAGAGRAQVARQALAVLAGKEADHEPQGPATHRRKVGPDDFPRKNPALSKMRATMAPERGPQTTLIGVQERPEAIQLRSYAVEVVRGPDAGRTFTGKKRSVLIGTHPSSDLALSDHHVSRLHARIDID